MTRKKQTGVKKDSLPKTVLLDKGVVRRRYEEGVASRLEADRDIERVT